MNVPISPGIQVGNTVYIGGTSPLDDVNNLIGANDAGLQTRIVLERIIALLASANMTPDDLVFVTVYLTDLSCFSHMNRVYSEILSRPYPARKVIQTPLTIEGAIVEMTAVAVRGPKTILNTRMFNESATK